MEKTYYPHNPCMMSNHVMNTDFQPPNQKPNYKTKLKLPNVIHHNMLLKKLTALSLPDNAEKISNN